MGSYQERFAEGRHAWALSKVLNSQSYQGSYSRVNQSWRSKEVDDKEKPNGNIIETELQSDNICDPMSFFKWDSGVSTKHGS